MNPFDQPWSTTVVSSALAASALIAAVSGLRADPRRFESPQAAVDADFEALSAGVEFRGVDWETEGFAESRWAEGFGQGRVFVDDSFPRSGSQRSLRVLYPEGGVGPVETGAQASLALEPRDEYYLSYWLRFDEDFSWGGRHHGGKLPGLASDQLCSGGSGCDGTNGFTARLMWRTGGKAVLYLYHMDKPHQWGEDFDLIHPDGSAVVFERGRWYQIIERVRINSAANDDGLVEIWVNQQPVLSLPGLRFVSDGDLVDTLFFSSFHGGNTEEWAPQQDSYINFDDFKVGSAFESVL